MYSSFPKNRSQVRRLFPAIFSKTYNYSQGFLRKIALRFFSYDSKISLRLDLIALGSALQELTYMTRIIHYIRTTVFMQRVINFFSSKISCSVSRICFCFI